MASVRFPQEQVLIKKEPIAMNNEILNETNNAISIYSQHNTNIFERRNGGRYNYVIPLDTCTSRYR